MSVHPLSFDVWDTDPGIPVPVWLGYVAREHVQDLGMMWSAYRANGFGHLGASGNGVPMDSHDTADDAEQQIRDYWEV